MERVQRQHCADADGSAGYVGLPGALARKCPNANREWRWQWVYAWQGPGWRASVDAALVELFLFLLQLVVEVVFQAAVETVFDLGLASRKSTPQHSTHSRLLVLVGLLILGALVGGASLALWPSRLFSPGPIPGMSLVLGPLAVGGVMHFWGKHRRARGKVTSSLATFEGGAAFALGTALVRFFWAG